MIYINKGESNEIVLTLTESVSIANPVFLFKFEWQTDLTIDPIYWIGTNTSTYTYRYDLFTFVEGTDETLKLGQYKYYVYEAPEGSTPTDEDGLTQLEEGRLFVNGTSSTIYD